MYGAAFLAVIVVVIVAGVTAFLVNYYRSEQQDDPFLPGVILAPQRAAVPVVGNTLPEEVLSPPVKPAREIPRSERWSILDDKRFSDNRFKAEELTAAFTAIEQIIYRNQHGEQQTDEDQDFELGFYRQFGTSVEYAFYTKIVGVSHRNRDGTLRRPAIKRCEMLDELDLIAEPDNEFDKNAIGIFSLEGKQLGYLEARLAGEVSRGILRGSEYTALFRCQTHHDDRVVGAVILLCRYRRGDILSRTAT
jgi:hypothetical protein